MTKVSLHEQTSDFTYWQTQPYEVRLAALEEIRREYHQWRYGAEPRFKEFIQSLNDNHVRYLVIGVMPSRSTAIHATPRISISGYTRAPRQRRQRGQGVGAVRIRFSQLEAADFLVQTRLFNSAILRTE